MIENIPGHWMIADLKSFLDGFGTIAKVEIFEDRQVLPFCIFLTIDWQIQRSWQSGLPVELLHRES
jgi:hypothetical protein